MNNPEDAISKSKAHVAEYKLFEKEFDIGAMRYDEMIRVLVDYISEKVIKSSTQTKKPSLACLEKISFYIEKASQYLQGEISEDEMNFYCNENIRGRRCDAIQKEDIPFMNVVQYILFNRVRSAIEKEGADYYIGFVFADVGEIDENACGEFRKFIEAHPIIQKYRIWNQ